MNDIYAPVQDIKVWGPASCAAHVRVGTGQLCSAGACGDRPVVQRTCVRGPASCAKKFSIDLRVHNPSDYELLVVWTNDRVLSTATCLCTHMQQAGMHLACVQYQERVKICPESIVFGASTGELVPQFIDTRRYRGSTANYSIGKIYIPSCFSFSTKAMRMLG